MKIAIIGSTGYQEMMEDHRIALILEATDTDVSEIEVKLPAFDYLPLNEVGIMAHNRALIEWADEVHIFWDNRSSGTVFDFGMCFALRKPIKIIYLNHKTFANATRQYAAECEVNT
jgi:nucleoside 2-deoxyribosyltransferase